MCVFVKIFHRVLIIFMPPKHQPDYPYLRHVRISRVHIFTLIQIISLAGMFGVKSYKPIAIGFPVLVSFLRENLFFVFIQKNTFKGTCNMFCT